jgi:enterochelin esterase-like enzyme
MARTKEQEAARLAKVAHAMDNWTRLENTAYVKLIMKERKEHEKEIVRLSNHALDLIQRRERRIRELEAQWEDLANTLNDAVEENFRLIKRIEVIEDQLLDCTCNEESI